MARSLNEVVLMGNLTRDPELRQSPNGQSVVNFSLALNRSYKDKDGQWQDAVDYVNVVAWASTAENVSKYLTKGRQAVVKGRLQSSSWEQDGQKRSKLEVVANDVIFIGGNGSSSNETNVNKIQNDDHISLDDIPF